MRQIALLGLLICFAPLASARVGNAPLKDVVKYSDLIGVGTVTRITTEQGIRLATVEFDQVLKGKAVSVEFVAEQTWTCDLSTARLGERGIYFLEFHKAYDRVFSRIPNEERTLNRPVYTIAHSGRGRLLLTGNGASELHSWRGSAGYWRVSKDIVFPKNLKITVRGQRVSAKASNLIAVVRRYVAPAKVA